ncbi:MAG: hypothetical protein ACP5LE_08280, partial [Thermoplasmata archaeon]
ITSDDEGSVSTVIYVNVSNVVPELYCMQHMEVIANTIYLDAAVFDSVNDYGMLNVSWMLVSFNGSVCNESLGYSRWLSYSGCEKGTGTYIFRCTVRDEIVSVSSELKVVLYCDSDGDLMQDIWEWTHGLNWRKNDSLEDPDNDGLKNIEEYYYGTHPQLRDTDGDGLTDGEEVQHYLLSPFNPDVDGDGLQDGTEVYNLYYYGTYWLNFVMFENTSREMNVSSWHAGIYNASIYGNATENCKLRVVVGAENRTLEIVRGNFTLNFSFTIANVSVISFGMEGNGTLILSRLDLWRAGSNPKMVDTDMDALDDLGEYQHHTSPVKPDTDNDGVWDRAELELGLSPLNPDCDNDSAADGLEIYWGTDPHSRDCDGDELDDGLELA